MIRKYNEEAVFAGTAAFILPVVLLVLASGGSSDSLMFAIDTEADALVHIRQLFSMGRIYIPGALSDILTCHFYPSFILAALIGGFIGRIVLIVSFYLRFELLSLGMYLFMQKHIKLTPFMSALMGVTYSISTISLIASVNPQLINVMAVMPFALCAIDNAMRRGKKIDLWLAALVISLFACGGFFGIVAGLIFTASSTWLLKQLLGEGKVSLVVKAYLIGLIGQFPVLIPVLMGGMPTINIKEEFMGSTVTFKFFDFLTTTLDGTPFYVPVKGSYAAFAVSILVLMLTVLFFLNSTIPWKAKISGIILLIVIPVSASWTLLNAILSVYGNTSTGVVSRLSVLAVLVMIMAGVSLRNINNCSRNAIFGSMAFVFALILISNSTSAGEVTRSVFCLWFSAGAAIFWCVYFLTSIEGKIKPVKVLAVIGAVGIMINIWHSFSVMTLGGSLPSICPEDSASYSAFTVESNEPIPLYNDNAEYICVQSDLRQIASEMDIQGLMNVVSNAALLDDAFTQADSFAVFTDGVSERGNGNYMALTPNLPYELLVRCENMDPNSHYYVYSSFTGENILTETYSGINNIHNLTGPYVKELDFLTDSVTLRQTGNNPPDNSFFTVWRADAEVIDALRQKVIPLNDFGGEVESEVRLTMAGYVTVITSVPYNSGYYFDVDSEGGSLSNDTFNFGGKLATVFDSRGASDITFRIGAPCAEVVIALIVWVLSSAVVIYNIFKYRKDVKVESHAEQNG